MEETRKTDEYWMGVAIELARKAAEESEVPVGCVITKDNVAIATGHNRRESLASPLAHAELIAIEDACKKNASWRLTGHTLYVTLEPCLMCAGALWQTRISRVVYGCKDAKGGALGSLYTFNEDSRLNHRYPVTEGILEGECRKLLQNFFQLRRT